MSALLLAVTLPGTRGLLRLMGTPEEQMDYAFNYIFIIFVGIPTTILYNMGACVLRALGDSKSPVWFLAAASAINIVLDLLTVCVLGLGVAGAAIATVVSQLGSGLLCVGYLKKHFPILRMEKDDWKLRRPEVMRLLGMGVPVGLQFSITAIGSVMLQSAVNSLGAVCVSGVAVAGKIYMLLACPFDALAMAATNFTGQNLGAGKYDRIRQGTYACLFIGILYCVLYILIAQFGTRYLSLLFMNAGVKLVAPGEEQVIEAVKKLEEQGTEVLVCGTCLNFFGIADKLSVGEVSNMYDILERMRESAKTITL